MAAKEFAVELDAVAFVIDVRQRLAQIKLAPVVRNVGLIRQVDENITQRLITAHRVVIAAGIFVATVLAAIQAAETAEDIDIQQAIALISQQTGFWTLPIWSSPSATTQSNIHRHCGTPAIRASSSMSMFCRRTWRTRIVPRLSYRAILPRL